MSKTAPETDMNSNDFRLEVPPSRWDFREPEATTPALVDPSASHVIEAIQGGFHVLSLETEGIRSKGNSEIRGLDMLLDTSETEVIKSLVDAYSKAGEASYNHGRTMPEISSCLASHFNMIRKLEAELRQTSAQKRVCVESARRILDEGYIRRTEGWVTPVSDLTDPYSPAGRAIALLAPPEREHWMKLFLAAFYTQLALVMASLKSRETTGSYSIHLFAIDAWLGSGLLQDTPATAFESWWSLDVPTPKGHERWDLALTDFFGGKDWAIRAHDTYVGLWGSTRHAHSCSADFATSSGIATRIGLYTGWTSMEAFDQQLVRDVLWEVPVLLSTCREFVTTGKFNGLNGYDTVEGMAMTLLVKLATSRDRWSRKVTLADSSFHPTHYGCEVWNRAVDMLVPVLKEEFMERHEPRPRLRYAPLGYDWPFLGHRVPDATGVLMPRDQGYGEDWRYRLSIFESAQDAMVLKLIRIARSIDDQSDGGTCSYSWSEGDHLVFRALGFESEAIDNLRSTIPSDRFAWSNAATRVYAVLVYLRELQRSDPSQPIWCHPFARRLDSKSRLRKLEEDWRSRDHSKNRIPIAQVVARDAGSIIGYDQKVQPIVRHASPLYYERARAAATKLNKRDLFVPRFGERSTATLRLGED